MFDLLTGAAKLIGGIAGIGGGSSKDQIPDYQAIRDRAMAAGFNPVTALGAGSWGNTNPAGQRLASSAAMANAFDEIDDVISGRNDEEDRNLELQNDLLEIETNKAKRGFEAKPAVGGYNASSPEPELKPNKTTGLAIHDSDVVDPENNPEPATEKLPRTQTNFRDLDAGPAYLTQDPRVIDAEAAEAFGTEPAGWPKGVSNILRTAKWEIRQARVVRQYGPKFAQHIYDQIARDPQTPYDVALNRALLFFGHEDGKNMTHTENGLQEPVTPNRPVPNRIHTFQR